ncbi:hypothetical protein MNB_SV-6-856 [hydrothermal vent metagenome]|uniref:Uncharacterized protein n=1 Tax=hydrothermal vent metagenome TaxID=652676 RepID=A0A1W1BJ51_9ZZZZ
MLSMTSRNSSTKLPLLSFCYHSKNIDINFKSPISKDRIVLALTKAQQS